MIYVNLNKHLQDILSGFQTQKVLQGWDRVRLVEVLELDRFHWSYFWLSQLKEKTCLGPSLSSDSICWSDWRRNIKSYTHNTMGIQISCSTWMQRAVSYLRCRAVGGEWHRGWGVAGWWEDGALCLWSRGGWGFWRSLWGCGWEDRWQWSLLIGRCYRCNMRLWLSASFCCQPPALRLFFILLLICFSWEMQWQKLSAVSLMLTAWCCHT